jgi:hypothetical protein
MKAKICRYYEYEGVRYTTTCHFLLVPVVEGVAKMEQAPVASEGGDDDGGDQLQAGEPMKIAEVGFSTGRYFLSVGGVIVAMEGDKCRENLPEEACEPIPPEELERATIGDQRAKDMPMHVVRFFRGDCWNKKNLTWVAKRINKVAAGEAEPYEQSEAIPKEDQE